MISHAVLIGDGRKFVSLLLTLKVDKDSISGYMTKKLSAEAKNFIKSKLKLSNINTVDEAV